MSRGGPRRTTRSSTCNTRSTAHGKPPPKRDRKHRRPSNGETRQTFNEVLPAGRPDRAAARFA
eukprot:10685540-Lingulodinium_polyedra.AAC.1